MNFENLPNIEGYFWRSINQDDLRALIQFEQVCSAFDDPTQTSSLNTWHYRLSNQMHAIGNSVIGLKDDQIIAAGWIDYSTELNHVRAFLDGCVHPDYRHQGIGRSLLTWLEVRANEHLQKIANGRKLVLRIMYYTRPPDAIKLFESSGFTFMYSEIKMAYNLKGQLPDYSSSPEMRFESWTLENSKEYYSIYKDAFQTRTENVMEEADWMHHYANNDDEDFRPDLSSLLITGQQAVAYTVCHVEKDRNGELRAEPWITQMGVRRSFRRQGFASKLLEENLRRMQKAGFSEVMLSVNTNNPGASKLYKRIGFEAVKTFTMYAKDLNP